MINATSNLTSGIAQSAGRTIAPGGGETGEASGSSFADVLKKSIGEVSKLQQDATAAVEDLATGKRNDMSNVMSAVEKADMAFKTLLAIRAKLMEAYEEIKSMQV